MKLIIELSAEDVNNTTIGIIQQLFAQNTKTTGPTTANIELYDLDEILPQPNSPTKQKQDNAERLQAFAKKIESTLNDREKKALEKFVNFYLPKINDWKPDVNIQNLWKNWVSSER